MSDTAAALLHKFIQAERHLNAKGTPIGMHHAFRTIGFTKITLATMFLLPLIADMFLWWQIDNILSFWYGIFSFWSGQMGFVGEIGSAPTKLVLSEISFPMPPFDAFIPSATTVYIHAVAIILLFSLSLLMSEKLMPLAYFLRTCLVIHFTAVIYFLISPDYFPYHLSDHMLGGMGLGIYIIFLIPPILGLIYYIFDFGIIKKILFTIVILSYFIVFIPMQYLLHALILHHFTLIFLPVLYLIFGLLLDVLMFIALYSYGMTWKNHKLNYKVKNMTDYIVSNKTISGKTSSHNKPKHLSLNKFIIFGIVLGSSFVGVPSYFSPAHAETEKMNIINADIPENSKLERNQSITIRGDVKKGAVVRVTGGEVRVEGNVEDGASIESTGNTITTNGGQFSIQSSGSGNSSTVIINGKRMNPEDVGGQIGITIAGRVAENATLISSNSISAHDIGSNSHLRAGNSISVGSIADGAVLDSKNSITAKEIGKNVTITVGNSVTADSIAAGTKITAGNSVIAKHIDASANIKAANSIIGAVQ